MLVAQNSLGPVCPVPLTVRGIPPRIGMALVHDHILLHESPELRVGVKHVIRTDVIYERV